MKHSADKESVEDLLHMINNTLNSVSLQSEVAQLHLKRGDLEASLQAMKVIQQECKTLASVTRQYSE